MNCLLCVRDEAIDKDRVHTFYPPREMTLMSLHWFNLFLLLKLKFCGKMDDRMRILTKCSLLHSTDSIATPKRQNAYERDFVHSYKQQRDLLYLSSHAFDRIIRVPLTHYCIELLGKGCNDTFWLHLRPCMLYCYGCDCTEVVDRVHTFYPPREMALVVPFHWLNLFILLKLKFCRKVDLHFCTLQTL